MKIRQKGRNILYLSYDGLSDPLGQSQILPYLIGLSKRGFHITIVSFEKRNRLSGLRKKIETSCAAHGVRWVPLMYHRSPPVLSTLYDLFSLRRKVSDLVRKSSFEVIHCRSYVTALIGLWAKKQFGVRFIFDMRGFWADERVEGGLWNLRNPLYRIIYNYFKRKEKDFFLHADAIISLTQAAKQEIQSQFGNVKVAVIPTCVDKELFDRSLVSESERNKIKQRLQLEDDDLILLYLGSLGTWYLYDAMVAFFEKVKARYPKTKLLFLTPDQHVVEQRTDFIVRTVPRNEVPVYISISHASLCFIKPSHSKKASSATKVAEALAMGVPVVCNAGWGDIDSMASRFNGIFIAEDTDVDSFIQKFFQNRHSPTAELPTSFTLESGVDQYAATYRDLLM